MTICEKGINVTEIPQKEEKVLLTIMQFSGVCGTFTKTDHILILCYKASFNTIQRLQII